MRFDKVALRFGARVQQALRNAVPAGSTLIVAITAPLRQPSKAAGELIEKLRALCDADTTKADLRTNLYDNSIVARIARGKADDDRVVVLVHNPHASPVELVKVAASVLQPPP